MSKGVPVVVIDERTGAERRADTLGPPAGLDDRRAFTDRRLRTPSGFIATDAIKMACPFCGGSESAVVRVNPATIAANCVPRRRECASCGNRFPTKERVDEDLLRQELTDRAVKGDAPTSKS